MTVASFLKYEIDEQWFYRVISYSGVGRSKITIYIQYIYMCSYSIFIYLQLELQCPRDPGTNPGILYGSSTVPAYSGFVLAVHGRSSRVWVAIGL